MVDYKVMLIELETEWSILKDTVDKKRKECLEDYNAALQATIQMRNLLDNRLSERFTRETMESESEDYILFLKEAVQAVENYRKEKEQIECVFNTLKSVIEDKHTDNLREVEIYQEALRISKARLDELRNLVFPQ